ncbi:MAG: Calx-beta domain-containing protein [Acidobacteriota bacterium]
MTLARHLSFLSLLLLSATAASASETDVVRALQGAPVDPCLMGPPPGTVLTFEIEATSPFSNGFFTGSPIPDAYGDLVTSSVVNSQGLRFSYCGGDTPHVIRRPAVVRLDYFGDNYGDLTELAYKSDRVSGDRLIMEFAPSSADQRVALYGFDIDSNLGSVNVPRVQIFTETAGESGAFANTETFTNVQLGKGHVSFDFDPPLLTPDPDTAQGSQLLTIVIDMSGSRVPADAVGIDNVHIAETGIARFESATFTASEADEEIVVVIERTAAANEEIPASVELDLTDITAVLDEDYNVPGVFQSGALSVSWPAGDRSPKTLRFPLRDDEVLEGDETFELRLVNPEGIGLRTSSAGQEISVATVVIEDDESVGIEIDGPRVLAVDQLATYQVTADCSPLPTLWSWSFGDAIASGPDDAAQVRLRWPTEGEKLVRAEALDGGCAGALSELSVSVQDGLGIGFATPNLSVREGDGEAELVLLRSGTAAASVLVELEDGTARRGADWTGPSSLLVEWQSGDPPEQRVVVDLVDDDVREPAESFRARLSAPLGGLLNEELAEVTIFDDDVSVGPPLPISAGPGPVNPAVAYSPLGGKAVVWVESATCIGAVGSSLCFKVLAQFFDTLDRPSGGVVEVSQSAASLSDRPAADFTPDGRLFVVWPQRDLAGKGAVVGDNLVGRFFVPGGDPVGEEIELVETSNGSVTDPDLEVDRNGDVAVVWEDNEEANARFVGADGMPQGGQVRPGAASSPERRPSVGRNSSGASVFVFEGGANRPGILARLFDDRGNQRSGLLRIDQDPDAMTPDAVVRDDGSFVVVYQRPGPSGFEVVLRRFDELGSQVGSETIVNRADGLQHVSPKVALNAGDDLFVTWIATPAARGVSGNLVGRFFDPQGEAVTEEIEIAEPAGGSAPSEPEVSINDDDEVTVVYEREGPSGTSEGIFRSILQPSLARDCVEGRESLCLQQQRFEVRADWQDFEGNNGAGRALSLTPDSGTFWFFSPDNVELIVKVLDACGVNGHYWLFAAGLTDVEVHLKVDDTGVGTTRSYFHSSGQPFETVRDIQAFPCAAGRPERTLSEEELAAAMAEVFQQAEEEVEQLRESASSNGQACSTTSTALCVNDSRFLLEVEWATAQGTSGQGRAVQLTPDSGTFWFFSPDNVELIFKVLDGCALNQRYWIFGSGLTDVAIEVRITDTVTGAVREFSNPLGQGFVPIRDINAFAGCP